MNHHNEEPMLFWKDDKWTTFVTEAHSRRKRTTNYKPASQKHTQALINLRVPVWVANELNASESHALIDRKLREITAYKEAKAQWEKETQERQQESQRQTEETARKITQTLQKSVAMTPQYDKSLDLYGTPAQNQYAYRIRTSLNPYLVKLKACAQPSSNMRSLLTAAIAETDARFWIAYRQCDIKPDIFKKMMADISRRMLLEDAEPEPVKSGIEWDDDSFDNPELEDWRDS
jgi:hypothetical protein